MKTHLDCVPCFFKQALSAARLAGAGQNTQKRIVNRVCQALTKFSFDLCPSYMGRTIYKIVMKETKNQDPFYTVKQKSNKLALDLYPKLKEKVKTSKDGFFVAVELAVAGNIIDFGIKDSSKVEKELEDFLNGNFNIHSVKNKAIFFYQKFRQAVGKAEKILYLGDNAGEIVFDRVLLEEIKTKWPDKQIFFVVKEKPIINDVLIEDALLCGIDKIVPVISSGCDAPGTIFEFCSPAFLSLYKKCDLIISKGQGNFEALSGKKKTIYFLFRAKCPVLAENIGCNLGDIILKRD